MVASVITDFAGKWPEVECCVTPTMFTHQFCRRAFKAVEELAADGQDVNIKSVWRQMGPLKTRGLLLMDLTNGNDFNMLKWEYEVSHQLASKPYRHVTFGDYVTQLITNYEQRKK